MVFYMSCGMQHFYQHILITLDELIFSPAILLINFHHKVVLGHKKPTSNIQHPWQINIFHFSLQLPFHQWHWKGNTKENAGYQFLILSHPFVNNEYYIVNKLSCLRMFCLIRSNWRYIILSQINCIQKGWIFCVFTVILDYDRDGFHFVLNSSVISTLGGHNKTAIF